MLARFRSLLSELSRRKVYRVAAVYAAVSFVVWQASEIAFPALGLPDWSITLVVVLTLVGFPVALVLAWAYEVTPEGVVRTDGSGSGADGRASPEEHGVASEGSPGDGRTSTPTAARSDRRRMAILPLTNIHSYRDEDYFAEGMTEELISVVSRIQGLDVIARTSVMAYRDTTKSVTEIGRELDARPRCCRL